MSVKPWLRAGTTGFAAVVLLAACGGGGGGSTPGTNPLPPVPTTAPKTYAVSGTVNGCDSTYLGAVEPTPSPAPQTIPPCTPNTALSGATVTLGQMPSSTCSGQSCAAPLNPLPVQTTAPNGTFAFAGVPAGTYMIAIGDGSGYAVLHQAVTVPTSGALSYKISQLSDPVGSLPAPNYNDTLSLIPGTSNGAQVTVGVTYVNAHGETVLYDCAIPVTPTTAQQVQVPSPPGHYTVTGYNVYVVTNHTGCFIGMSRQNASPIPIGTPFTVPGTPVVNGINPPTTGTATATLGEKGWLAEVNWDRAQYGATTPAVIDENAQEVARICAMYMANGETGHSDPYLCTSPSGNAVDQGGGYAQYVAQYPTNGGLYAWRATYDSAASDYQMADGNNFCPKGTSPYCQSGYPYGMMTDSHLVWIGLADWPDAFDTGSMTNADFIYAEVYH
ncbi:MAG: CAP domain-containing protein [Vulcanimicrobiaceae bacterium]